LRLEVKSLLKFESTSDKLINVSPENLAAEMFSDEELHTSLIDWKIGHYNVKKLLGKGGMGEVYLAQDTKLDRKVALKILPPEFAEDSSRMNRFVREAKSASALNHPNIITIHEIGESNGTHFIAMELIDGETLNKHRKTNPLSYKSVLEIAIQIASALNEAHTAGIIHRDIKPDNVMIRGNGLVKILDFGIAKFTDLYRDAKTSRHREEDRTLIAASTFSSIGMIIGTANYMSPEQAHGKGVDPRSDIFSFGIVLYEMLSGELPFEGENPIDTIATILRSEPIPISKFVPDVPAEIEQIIDKMLRKERSERYQSVGDLLIDLRNLKQNFEFTAKSDDADQLQRTTQTVAIQTDGGDKISTQSSAEYIVSKIKYHKFWTISAFAILIAVAFSAFFYLNRTPVLTDKDTILIADFENKTDDPIFSATLKQGLAVQLGQSPFLRIFPQAEVKETLKLMQKNDDEKITPEIAREICLRKGVKVFITASIAPLGNNYVITLQAIKTENGDAIVTEQNEANSKEKVLQVLGKTASQLRKKLGESLISIEKFDAPIEQATTSSLEALKAYSSAIEYGTKRENSREAMSNYFQIAIKLDPNFVLAYRDLARLQFNSGRRPEALASITKAFELRGRTSENEKLSVEVLYYVFAVEDAEKAAEIAELWKQTFPRLWQPYHSLADIYFESGQYEKSVENGLEAVRLNPTFATVYTNPAGALFRLNRFSEAKELYRQAMANNLDHIGYHLYLFWIGYFEKDTVAARQQIDWMRKIKFEHTALAYESQLAVMVGRWKESVAISARAMAESEKYGDENTAHELLVWNAIAAVLFNDCQTAKQNAEKVLPLTENTHFIANAAFALAMCGEERQALKIANELNLRFPKDKFVQELRLPTIRAAIELNRKKPEEAIELLQSTSKFNGYFLNYAAYVKGIALQRTGRTKEAAVEFQNIHKNPGWYERSPAVPISFLWEARSLALSGDAIESRKAYEEFFALLKNADADLPILMEGRNEYKRLK
jgi:serine/threonine protein kinase/Tfp pilus assembly protein PilF